MVIQGLWKRLRCFSVGNVGSRGAYRFKREDRCIRAGPRGQVAWCAYMRESRRWKDEVRGRQRRREDPVC